MIPDWISNNFYNLYLILRIASQIFMQLGWHYLVQDKYCLNYHNQTEYFCQTINHDKNGTEAHFKDEILADSVSFNQY